MRQEEHPARTQANDTTCIDPVCVLSRFCLSSVQVLSEFCQSSVQVLSVFCPGSVQVLWCTVYFHRIMMMLCWPVDLNSEDCQETGFICSWEWKHIELLMVVSRSWFLSPETLLGYSFKSRPPIQHFSTPVMEDMAPYETHILPIEDSHMGHWV